MKKRKMKKRKREIKEMEKGQRMWERNKHGDKAKKRVKEKEKEEGEGGRYGGGERELGRGRKDQKLGRGEG